MRIKKKKKPKTCGFGWSFNRMRRGECEGPHGMHKSCYNPTLAKNASTPDKTYLEDKRTYPKLVKM